MNINKIFKSLRSTMKESNPEGNPGAMIVMNKDKKQAVIYVQGKDAIKEVIKGIDIASDCNCPECRAKLGKSNEFIADAIKASMEEDVEKVIADSKLSDDAKDKVREMVADLMTKI